MEINEKTQNIEKDSSEAADFLPINGTDYIEFYVGNAKQSAHYYQSVFGYELVAYAGLETGLKDMQQGKVRLVLTTSLDPDNEISAHVRRHGDGVKVLALWVDDAEKSYNETIKRGAKSAIPPQTHKDEFGEVKTASIYTYGETIHTFVERKNYKGVFMPGYQKSQRAFKTTPVGLKYIDHCVGNVELGQMDTWVQFYEDVMGFKLMLTFDD